jgi:RNA polymerase sigma-70 factor, ECF subfamily
MVVKNVKNRDSLYLERAYEEQRFTVLLDEYGEKLTRLAYTYVKDWGKAEDIVQDTFVSFYEKQHHFRGECSLKNWLYKLTINRCKDYLKSSAYKRMVFGTILEKWIPTSNSSPELKLISKSEYEELATHIMNLPIKYRECIIFYYQEELSVAEMSQMLHEKESTIKTRLHRARQMLKKALVAEGRDLNG